MKTEPEIVYIDSKTSKLTVAKDRVTIKLSNRLSPEDATRLKGFLAHVATLIPADVGLTVRGQVGPDRLHRVRMQTESKQWQKIFYIRD